MLKMQITASRAAPTNVFPTLGDAPRFFFYSLDFRRREPMFFFTFIVYCFRKRLPKMYSEIRKPKVTNPKAANNPARPPIARQSLLSPGKASYRPATRFRKPLSEIACLSETAFGNNMFFGNRFRIILVFGESVSHTNVANTILTLVEYAAP
jgi:hypothetical protein